MARALFHRRTRLQQKALQVADVLRAASIGIGVALYHGKPEELRRLMSVLSDAADSLEDAADAEIEAAKKASEREAGSDGGRLG